MTPRSDRLADGAPDRWHDRPSGRASRAALAEGCTAQQREGSARRAVPSIGTMKRSTDHV